MANTPSEEHFLDNAVWHTLRGPLSRFAAPNTTAEFTCFDRDVNIFGAVEETHDEAWMQMAEAIGLDGSCMLFRDQVSPSPQGWQEHFRGQCWQMVAGELAARPNLEVIPLGPDDRAEMLALAELTEPGPFFSRTAEMGRFVGVRDENALIAMAGERFRVPGYVEVSAVCTHPDAQGRGLASELTLNAAYSIRDQGDEAFLHVLDTNENAFRLYQKLGFVVRRKVDVVFAQWRGSDWKPDDEAELPEFVRTLQQGESES